MNCGLSLNLEIHLILLNFVHKLYTHINLHMYSYIHMHTYTHTSLAEIECHTTVLGGSTEIIICHSITSIQNKYSWPLPNHAF